MLTIRVVNRGIWMGLMLVACGDDGGGAGPDAMPTPDTTQVDAMSCAAGTSPWTITFRQDAFDGPALADVHACVPTHPEIPCGDTGIDGTWTFCAPSNSEIAISAEKLGYMSTLIPRVTGTQQPMDPRARIHTLNVPNCSLWTSGGVSCPASASDPGGLLWVPVRENMPGVDAQVTNPPGYPAPIGDASIELTPPPLVGPFYGVGNMTDPNLTATHPATGNAFAGGVTEGDGQIVSIAKQGSTCHAFSYDTWPGPTPGTIRVPIRRGFRTTAVVTCDPTP